jgi:hypothetical protein
LVVVLGVEGEFFDEFSFCGDDADFGFVDERPDGCSGVASSVSYVVECSGVAGVR